MRYHILLLAGSLISIPSLAANNYGLWDDDPAANSDLLLAMNGTGDGKATLKSEDKTRIWTGDLAFGYVTTSGNSSEKTLKFHSDIQRHRGDWHYEFVTDATNSKSEGERTAERYFMSHRGAYDFTENNYAFAYLSVDSDRFSGFRYKGTAALGYGRRLINRENMTWDIEGGPGYRRSEVTSEVPGENDSEDGIIRLASQFQWALSDNAAFEQELSVDAGEEDTISRSVTSLKSQVVGNVAVKLSYTARHTKDAPPDRENLDTEFSVTVVYGF